MKNMYFIIVANAGTEAEAVAELHTMLKGSTGYKFGELRECGTKRLIALVSGTGDVSSSGLPLEDRGKAEGEGSEPPQPMVSVSRNEVFEAMRAMVQSSESLDAKAFVSLCELFGFNTGAIAAIGDGKVVKLKPPSPQTVDYVNGTLRVASLSELFLNMWSGREGKPLAALKEMARLCGVQSKYLEQATSMSPLKDVVECGRCQYYAIDRRKLAHSLMKLLLGTELQGEPMEGAEELMDMAGVDLKGKRLERVCRALHPPHHMPPDRWLEHKAAVTRAFIEASGDAYLDAPLAGIGQPSDSHASQEGASQGEGEGKISGDPLFGG